jgi:hypothetical protein
MGMSLYRRTLLGGGSAVVASLSGCLDVFDGSEPTVDLKLLNYTTRTQPLIVEILREDRDEHGDATAYVREFETPPPSEGESAGVVRETDIVERRRYLLRVLLKHGSGEWHHHHFYPGEATTEPDSEELTVRVYRAEGTDELYTRFG